jgi:hypothetical protein
MKRGKCNSSLCRANEALTKYLDKLIDNAKIDLDKERNSNFVILKVCAGNLTHAYPNGKDKRELFKEQPLIDADLYCVLYNLCEHEDEDQ